MTSASSSASATTNGVVPTAGAPIGVSPSDPAGLAMLGDGSHSQHTPLPTRMKLMNDVVKAVIAQHDMLHAPVAVSRG